jgi:uncharacterized membrane protein
MYCTWVRKRQVRQNSIFYFFGVLTPFLIVFFGAVCVFLKCGGVFFRCVRTFIPQMCVDILCGTHMACRLYKIKKIKYVHDGLNFPQTVKKDKFNEIDDFVKFLIIS